MLDSLPAVIPVLLPWIALAFGVVLVFPPLAFHLVFGLLRAVLPSRHLELLVGPRYLRARRRPRLIGAVTYISVAGITLGVMALIVVLGVMSGFEEDIKRKILGTNSHVVVIDQRGGAVAEWRPLLDRVRATRGVATAAPFVFSQVMLSSENGVTGAILRGIDPAAEGAVTDLARNLRSGSLDALLPVEGGLPGVIIGQEMAVQLGLTTGRQVRIIAPFGSSTPAGPAPKIVDFRVVGVFKSGMFEYDSSLAYIHLAESQRFLGLGDAVSGIEVRVDDIYGAGRVAADLRDSLGFPLWARDWMEMNHAYFSALRLEKVVMFVILTLVVLVASFNIVSSLIMKVLEKHRDIAILKSFGAGRGQIMGVFMAGGVVIGLAGTLLGDLLGVGLLAALQKYRFITLPSSVYYIDTLPVKLEPGLVAVISVASVGISFLATIYPAWKAAGVDPVVTLRYE